MRNGIMFIQLMLLRLFLGMCLLAALVSCNSKPDKQDEIITKSPETTIAVEERISIPDSITEFLLDAAATDFHTSKMSKPIIFRDVKIGVLQSENEEGLFILCGYFLEQQKEGGSDWMSFATIKTSPYEQWIGRQASTFCNDPNMSFENDNDLSGALKNKLEAL